MVVKSRQPFLDWAQSIDHEEGLALEDVRQDSSAYVVPQIWEDSDQLRVLEWCHVILFEAELRAWYTDPAVWPQHRDLKTFLEWFDVEFHSLVFGLSDTPVQAIDYGLDDDKSDSNGN